MAQSLEVLKMKKAPTHDQAHGAYGEQISFLPPPPFCPTWPKKNTLADRALGLLIDGRMTDTPDFQKVTASWRLADVVCDLRDLGWPIESIDIPAPTKDRQNRFIALYRLPSKYAAQARAMGSTS
jgi:hypothetical protein